jgi:hypothetical protein
VKLVEPPVDLKCPPVDNIAFYPNESKVNLPKSYKNPRPPTSKKTISNSHC